MRNSLAEQMFHTLEEEILTGVRAPGDSLTELRLCQQYQVSRTPVREALGRLEQEGLVTVLPNRSAVVAGVSVQDMLDIYEIRLRVEGLAARWSAERITPAALQELQHILELQEFYTGKKDADRLHELDTAFHRALYSDCGSQTLTAVLTDLHRRIRRFRQASLTEASRAAAALQEHRAIVQALAAQNGPLAEQCTAEHILHARRHLEAIYHTEKERL